MKLDEKNWYILSELQTNARISLQEISKKVGLSAPSVSERIAKMEDAGVIEGYSAHVNLGALGYSLGIYISIKIRFGQVKKFEEYILTVPEIIECHKLTGHDCMLLKGYIKDPKHLEQLNSKLAVYGELTTSLILNSIVSRKIIHEKF